MRRLFFTALAALMLATAVPAAAITYGQPDGNDHLNVGLVAFYDGGKFIWRCSGTLVTPTVLLTAGHCTAPEAGVGTPDYARVWFGSQIPIGTGGTDPTDLCRTGRVGYPCTGGDSTGTPVSAGFVGLTLPNTHDVGVVLLDTAQSMTPATLPALGYLDTFATKRGLQDTSLEVVGYGLLEVRPFPNAGGTQYRTRYEASQQIKDLRSALTDGYNLGATNAPGNGLADGYVLPGGTCNGDSGGPVFHRTATGELVLVGVTSFGLNSNCKGGDYAFRTDIQETRTFLATYGVPLP